MKNDMKTFRRVQKLAVVIGLACGIWLAARTDAGTGEMFCGLVTAALSLLISLSLQMEE